MGQSDTSHLPCLDVISIGTGSVGRLSGIVQGSTDSASTPYCRLLSIAFRAGGPALLTGFPYAADRVQGRDPICPAGRAAMWPCNLTIPDQPEVGSQPGVCLLQLPAVGSGVILKPPQRAPGPFLQEPIWWGWSADSQFCAVAWQELGKPGGAAVAVYSGKTGGPLGYCNLTDTSRNPTSCMVDMSFAWSPSLPLLLMRNGDQASNDANSLLHAGHDKVWTLSRRGFTLRDGSQGPLVGSKVSWSPCGEFLDEFTETEHDLRYELSIGTRGVLCNALTGDELHSRKHPDSCYDISRLVWSQNGRACLALNQEATELILISNGKAAVRAYGGPRPNRLGSQAATMGFSPCGHMLWLFEELPRSGEETSDEEYAEMMAYRKLHESPEVDPQRLYRMWQGCIDSEAAECSPGNHILCLGNMDLTTMAWHPNPASKCIFAIAAEGSGGEPAVVLFGSNPLQELRRWSSGRLSRHWIHKVPGPIFMHLAWSPDGSQLAFSINGVVAMLYFGDEDYELWFCEPYDACNADSDRDEPDPYFDIL